MSVSYTRHSVGDVDRQAVAIQSVNLDKREAMVLTRAQTMIKVDCSYAVGESFITPAVGEQWYIERYESTWKLQTRIPFNDETLLIEPEEGQVSVGSDKGPLELNGTELRAHGPVIIDGGKVLQFGTGHAYRDNNGTLEHRSSTADDDDPWLPVFPGVDIPEVPVLSVAGRTGDVVIVANDISNATAAGKQVLQIASLTALRTALAIPYPIHYAQTFITRAVGYGENTMGLRIQDACTINSITWRCGTAGVGGNMSVELRKNGALVTGTQTAITPAQQASALTVTGSWSFAAGDLLQVYVSQVSPTPGVGLVADMRAVLN
ncbi:hypothetical protein MYRNA_133 [Mycobacterium phage Myrna]|uniref:Minor tail protein n=1 Tax=Mycobacterium phage Myrna TaxID=546805 RepID=B5LJD7_9CAUD|nr:minor tail protein [Mycobacterium phage Myrna]ACH62134.1 hypothetical protein MYRNA_133 [Mycobacterium phage Myrna]